MRITNEEGLARAQQRESRMIQEQRDTGLLARYAQHVRHLLQADPSAEVRRQRLVAVTPPDYACDAHIVVGSPDFRWKEAQTAS